MILLNSSIGLRKRRCISFWTLHWRDKKYTSATFLFSGPFFHTYVDTQFCFIWNTPQHTGSYFGERWNWRHSECPSVYAKEPTITFRIILRTAYVIVQVQRIFPAWEKTFQDIEKAESLGVDWRSKADGSLWCRSLKCITSI